MTLNEFDAYFRDYLAIGSFPSDPSRNGIQCGNRDPDGKHLRKAAFAVDTCAETIRRAARAGADVLFVHHGVLWGECARITGGFYRRIRALIDADMALYACHLPLDAHPESGNNYGLAARLGLRQLAPFGEWRGSVIGVQGVLPAQLAPDEIATALFPGGAESRILPFGRRDAARVAIVSGGGGDELPQAVEAGADVFITGEIRHEHYHAAEEAGITVIAAGHYRTETVGVSLLAEKLRAETDMEAVFIDVPTGL